MLNKLFLFIFLFLSHTLFSWETELQAYLDKNNVAYIQRLRFYTYIYSAQSESVTYTPAVRECVSKKIIEYFFPNFSIDFACTNDFETEQLAENILCPYLNRLHQEAINTHTFPSKCWFKQIPEEASHVAHWIPWSQPLLQPPPPIPACDKKRWAEQIILLKKIRQCLTPQQETLVQLWAGHYGHEYEWLFIANAYMQQNEVPQSKLLLVRATLLQGLYDGIIAELQAKYTYCVPRPFTHDHSIQPLLKDLRSPSYPSGHAIQGAIFARIMTYFFPDDHVYWQHLKNEASNSRLWAGVHYPEDIKQGNLLGDRIAIRQLGGNGICSDALVQPLW